MGNGEAWILGIQMELRTRDYRTSAAFEKALRRAIAHCAAEYPEAFKQEDAPRLIVLPECLGGFLLFTVAGVAECFQAPTDTAALQTLLAALCRLYGTDWSALKRRLGREAPAGWDKRIGDLQALLVEIGSHGQEVAAAEKRHGETQAKLERLPDEAPRGPEAEERQTALERELAQHEAHLAALHRRERLMGSELVRILLGLYAKRIVKVFDRVLARLARETKSWIVAGSLYAPWLEPVGGRLALVKRKVTQEKRYQARMARLVLRPLKGEDFYGLSPLYDPNGDVVAVFPKCFPTTDEIETMGCVGVDPSEWKAYSPSPFGTLGSVVCADSWYPEMYRRVQAQEVQVLAVPSFDMDRDAWDRPWHGYSGSGYIPVWQESAVEDLVSQRAITGGGAWVCFSMTHQMPNQAATRRGAPIPEVGVNVFATGRIFGSRLGGRSVALWFDATDNGRPDVESAYAPYLDEPAHIAVRLVNGQVTHGKDDRPKFRENTRGSWEAEGL